MALSDLWKAIDAIREAFTVTGVDVSYYLVLGGLVLILFTVVSIVGIIAYKFINNAVNADALGFVKSIVVIAIAILALGLILP